MEKPEDKFLQEKIISLDTLPEGYTPNIESKWMLIQESLEAHSQKKKIIYWRWMNAAAILLLISGVFYFLSFNTEEKIVPPTIAHQPKTIKEEKSIPIIEDDKKISGKTEKKKIQKNTKISNAGNNHSAIADEQKKNNIDEIDPLINLSPTTIEIQKENTANIPSPHKKQRYIQQDFEDSPALLTNTPDNKDNRSFSFKIKLQQHPASYSSVDILNSPVRIHKSF